MLGGYDLASYEDKFCELPLNFEERKDLIPVKAILDSIDDFSGGDANNLQISKVVLSVFTRRNPTQTDEVPAEKWQENFKPASSQYSEYKMDTQKVKVGTDEDLLRRICSEV
jgi:hypothetical protein